MKISTDAIVSNSEMIKSYKSCREKAETYGKIFILKNNQPDAILISAAEYEKLFPFIEYIDSLDEQELESMFVALPVTKVKKADV